MQFIRSNKIPDLIKVIPDVFSDDRGFFLETYNEKVFAANGIDTKFVQDNYSHSVKGVLRGLHFQKPPFAQAKLVRCTAGNVLDVAVDIRQNSPTFGQFEMFELSAENHQMLFIPQGFAHGFVALSDTADFQYKCDNFYNQASESGIIYNDPKLAITWPKMDYIVSDKDQTLGDLDTVRGIF